MRPLAVAIVFLVFACRSPTEGMPRIDVTLTVDRDVVDPPNPVRLTIRVVNRDSRVVSAMNPLGYACRPAYDVLDHVGEPISLPGRFCLAIGYLPRQLAPGESITITDQWSGNTQGPDDVVKAVPPGLYHIVARVVVDGREVGSEPADVRVASLATVVGRCVALHGC